MKVSRDGVLPQIEPTGWIGKWQTRLGGARRLFQRSGIISRPITMWGAITAAWGTFDPLHSLFPGYGVFIVTAFALLIVWGVIDFSGLMPGEQAFGQNQSQRAERSPLKRDTEAIREALESAYEVRIVNDGGDRDELR